MEGIRRWIVVAGLLGVLLSPVAQASALASHAEGTIHHYVYYPAHRIYFEPDQRAWFWYHAGRWWTDNALPHDYVSLTHDGVYVDLETSRPYERQAWVEQQYGTPDQNERRHHRKSQGRDPYPTVTARATGIAVNQGGLRA